MQQPLISIAMATYNGERFLKEQLDSIYAQTYQNIEVIVCDDSSIDSTVEILKEYNQKFNLKYFVNEKNLGYLKNFEKAISLCSGEYIALADQDDIWLPHKLEILLKAIEGKSLVFSDAKLIDELGQIFALSFHEYQGIFIPPQEEYFQYLLSRNFVTGCTALFDAAIVNKILPIPTEVLVHDWWLAFCASLYEGLVYVPKPLVLYRQHGGNNIGASKTNKAIRLIRDFHNFFSKKSEKKSRKREKINRLNAYLDYLHEYLSDAKQKIKLLSEFMQLFKSNSKRFDAFRNFRIACKFRKVLCPGRSTAIQLLHCFANFFLLN